MNQYYIDSLKSIGAQISNTSKWLNGAVIAVDTLLKLDTIIAQPFVKAVDTVRYQDMSTKNYTVKKNDLEKKSIGQQTNNYDIDYGYAAGQIRMLNLHKLAVDGYRGKNKIIAVLDAGFSNADAMMALHHLFGRNQIIATRDFVDNTDEVYDSSFHGQAVLSIMAARLPGNYLGSAPSADYALLRTENAWSEYPIEELNWAFGAEFADSLGADIINSSLGYTTFDYAPLSYTYEDMDGNTAYSSKAASIAANKGILVVNSAGNSGNANWNYIGAPADADSVMTIGAVNKEGAYASFSSTGPSSSGTLKPNVTAVGEGTAFVTSDDQVYSGNGTSFSAPLISGAAASLWQANPEATNMEIKEAIEHSASNYMNPDTLKGYGIPDFQLASILLKKSPQSSSENIIAMPNPFQKILYVKSSVKLSSNAVFEINDINGRMIRRLEPENKGSSDLFIFKGLESLSQGMYILKVLDKNIHQTLKIFKAY